MHSEKQATQPEELERQVMCPSVAKNEREWWAANEIVSLRAEIVRLHGVIEEQTGRAEWNYECATRCEEKVIQRDAEIARLRLTDEEREAIRVSIQEMRDHTVYGNGYRYGVAATLQSMLSRMGDCPAADNVAHRNNGTIGSE